MTKLCVSFLHVMIKIGDWVLHKIRVSFHEISRTTTKSESQSSYRTVLLTLVLNDIKRQQDYHIFVKGLFWCLCVWVSRNIHYLFIHRILVLSKFFSWIKIWQMSFIYWINLIVTIGITCLDIQWLLVFCYM